MGLRAGISDLVVVLDSGKAVFIEVKTPTGKHNENQKKFIDICKQKGWSYFTARNSADVAEYLDGIE
jgi:hypothetical protein